MSLSLDNPKCPYCKFQFEKPAKRKRKCPSCKNQFFVLKGKFVKYQTWENHLKRERIKDFIAKLKFHQNELESLSKSGVTKVQILAASDSCEECKKLAGKSISIHDAFNSELLPCRTCTTDFIEGAHGDCRCCYISDDF